MFSNPYSIFITLTVCGAYMFWRTNKRLEEKTMKENNSFWIGKIARLEIVKDGNRLNFHNAVILEIDESHVTFRDSKDNKVLAFNRDLIKEMMVE